MSVPSVVSSGARHPNSFALLPACVLLLLLLLLNVMESIQQNPHSTNEDALWSMLLWLRVQIDRLVVWLYYRPLDNAVDADSLLLPTLTG
jgi:hypothetical protein